MSSASAPPPSTTVAEQLLALPDAADTQNAPVTLSTELIGLLSSQLYRTPAKAIEELVVNSFDADAKVCRLHVPTPADSASDPRSFCAVWDNGTGMDAAGLIALWEIGSSPKKRGGRETKLKRKQIGRFGIGKLATYSIAHLVTYISKTANGILGVTVDFDVFSDLTGHARSSPINLRVTTIADPDIFLSSTRFKTVFEKLGVGQKELELPSWTLVLLENLKDRVQEVTEKRLSWLLSTAMPLAADFQLFLNTVEIRSSKESINAPVEFDVAKFPNGRIKELNKSGNGNWHRQGEALIGDNFPSGITFQVKVFEKPVGGGKSDDMTRSHGFFLRVRGRLINEDDPLFGLAPRSHTTFQRFRADVFADDLDALLLSSREEIEQSPTKRQLESLMGLIFNEARIQYENWLEKQSEAANPKPEGERVFVQPRLVEEPLADVLLINQTDMSGGDANKSWFYVAPVGQKDIQTAAEGFYTRPREQFKFRYEKAGQSARMVSFRIQDKTFIINSDHDLVASYCEDPTARRLLEDLVTADMLLEVYLREEGVPVEIVGEILERRDQLLRGLARENTYSFVSIAKSLRDAAADKYDLEIALVRAARALGFVASHIAGAGEPDGMARLSEYPGGEQRITLEAKSSKDVPSLSHIDFGGLKEHVTQNKCNGCLLVAPAYPNKDDADSAASKRAKEQEISCWTIEDLASVMDAAESRHITARHVLDIVKTSFSPLDVKAAVELLIKDPAWAQQELLQQVLVAFRKLEMQYVDRERTVDMVAGKVEWGGHVLKMEDVETAIRQLAASSKGGMRVTDKNVIVLATSIDEVENRAAGLVGTADSPRGKTGFRDHKTE